MLNFFKSPCKYKVLQINLNYLDIAKAKVIVPKFKDASITNMQVACVLFSACAKS